jgi:hypothetical protein
MLAACPPRNTFISSHRRPFLELRNICAHHRCLRSQNWLGRRGRGQSRLKRLYSVKNVLFDGLQVVDVAGRLLLASCEAVDAALDSALDSARHLLLTGGYTGGDPVEALPHRIAIKRYCFERGDLPGRVAVGLPSQGGSYANGKCDQVAGEDKRL